jgi:hypothetical protein
MFGSKGPVEDAYYHAASNRLFSIVYFALNDGISPGDRKSFRKIWVEHGSFRLAELLLLCARPDWADYSETFCLRPWIADHLRAFEPANLCYILDAWLASEPLPTGVSDDPLVEDRKVKELRKLFSALNP